MVRAAALLAVLAALAAYYGVQERLPNLSDWGDVAFLSLALLPAFFLLSWLALPFRAALGTNGLAIATIVFAVFKVLFELTGLEIPASFALFCAVTAAGWWFLSFFEHVTWVLLVALLITPVDIFSVARGPTKEIVENQPHVFDFLSVAFLIPGEQSSARLGFPDVLFFSLFLGGAARFGLRPGWTWAAMVGSFGLTIVGAVLLDVAGLPALPLLSAAFVLVNADLLWRAFRQSRSRGGDGA